MTEKDEEQNTELMMVQHLCASAASDLLFHALGDVHKVRALIDGWSEGLDDQDRSDLRFFVGELHNFNAMAGIREGTPISNAKTLCDLARASESAKIERGKPD